MKSLVGTSFGQYEIRRLIGKGGMGEVYEAYDTKKGRAVALKLLTDNYADDEKFRERFLRESRAAAILQEPHVIPIHIGVRLTVSCTSTCDWSRVKHCTKCSRRVHLSRGGPPT
ncbi:hypothetical protein MAHJHV61_50510 [Mycobacterium avium subsp. hominissuis]